MSSLLHAGVPVLLGLSAAITWGAADFCGGLATRRATPSRVVLLAHGTSLVALLAFSLRSPVHLSTWAIASGVLSGVAGGIALMLFYEALSLGAMGLSAAIAGLLTAVLPVLLALRSQGPPGVPQIAGFAVAAASIVLIAYAPAHAPASFSGTDAASEARRGGEATTLLTPGRPSRKPLLFAVLAGLGFGLQLVWLHTSASSGSSSIPAGASAHPLAPVLRALLLSRAGGTAAALAVLLGARARRGARPQSIASAAPPPGTPPGTPLGSSFATLALLAGLLDTSGNGLYMLSSLSGRLDVAAVLSSLYPGATILLAAIFLRERATRLQTLGMTCAFVAVVLIAA